MHCVVNEPGKGMLHEAKARSIAAAAVCPPWEKREVGGISVCTGRQSSTLSVLTLRVGSSGSAR